MKLDYLPWILGCALLILAVVAVVHVTRKPRYRRNQVMTENEAEFYHRLVSALPDCQIWPQVPLLSLIRPDAKPGSRAFWAAFRKISNARVDWVIVQDLEILAIVELDDRTHDAKRDAARDLILKSCGYRVLRFSSRRRPRAQQLREAVFRHLA